MDLTWVKCGSRPMSKSNRLRYTGDIFTYLFHIRFIMCILLSASVDRAFVEFSDIGKVGLFKQY